jgi:hypothetical protein
VFDQAGGGVVQAGGVPVGVGVGEGAGAGAGGLGAVGVVGVGGVGVALAVDEGDDGAEAVEDEVPGAAGGQLQGQGGCRRGRCLGSAWPH